MRSYILFCLLASSQFAYGEEAVKSAHNETKTPFTAFTGKIAKNKVRLRLQPTLDAPVIKELNRGDMLIVAGETDEFYSILPPAGTKAYIFRTFVLDNSVEGTRVNVRIEPNMEAPTIAQLNTGDKVQGVVSPINSKWLEIGMPDSARFYVAKEYVEKIGDQTLMATLIKKKEDINNTLNSAYAASQDEMKKNFPDIRLDDIVKKYTWLSSQDKEFPEQSARAKELLKTLQDSYLQKKIAYLEDKAKNNVQVIVKEVPAGQAVHETLPVYAKPAITDKMSAWNQTEDYFFKQWQQEHPGQGLDEFYQDLASEAKTLNGLVETYNRPINNKPGDYVLINPTSKGIIAYLYSNKVNLQDYVGQSASLKVVERPNNNFAFPAFFVLEAQ
jgi:hypothetical protein